MRKKVSIKRFVWKLRCRKCGKKKTYYDSSLPKDVYWSNGWYLYKTELCNKCVEKLIQNGKEFPYQHLRY